VLIISQSETGRQFDFKSEDFTLERIIDWGFDQFYEKIKDISNAATKELAIENALAEINAVWEYTSFDLVPYKEKGHLKIRYENTLSAVFGHNFPQRGALRFTDGKINWVDVWVGK